MGVKSVLEHPVKAAFTLKEEKTLLGTECNLKCVLGVDLLGSADPMILVTTKEFHTIDEARKYAETISNFINSLKEEN